MQIEFFSTIDQKGCVLPAALVCSHSPYMKTLIDDCTPTAHRSFPLHYPYDCMIRLKTVLEHMPKNPIALTYPLSMNDTRGSLEQRIPKILSIALSDLFSYSLPAYCLWLSFLNELEFSCLFEVSCAFLGAGAHQSPTLFFDTS